MTSSEASSTGSCVVISSLLILDGLINVSFEFHGEILLKSCDEI